MHRQIIEIRIADAAFGPEPFKDLSGQVGAGAIGRKGRKKNLFLFFDMRLANPARDRAAGQNASSRRNTGG